MIKEQQSKEGTLIHELDSLRCTLNSGPEFQQDIPTLNEQYPLPKSVQEPSAASNKEPSADSNKKHSAEPNQEPLAEPDQKPSLEPEPYTQCDLFRDSDGIIHDPDIDVPILTEPYEELPEEETEEKTLEAPIDINKLSDETDLSLMGLEHVLDELVAEQLPKLEQQLRDKLRNQIETCSETNERKNLETIESTTSITNAT